jgi:two-component system sensor histidine kinase/response regulator
LIEISVCDTGVGIKAEDIDKLFRVDVTHTTLGTAKEVGNGLGFNLVSRIC